MNTAAVAEILLLVNSLVQAGLSFRQLVNEIRSMEANGATPEQVSQYLRDRRDKAMAALREIVEG